MINFLVKYSKSEGLKELLVHPTLEEAVSEQFYYERNNYDDDLVVVALQADSLETLMKTHSRFFWVNYACK